MSNSTVNASRSAFPQDVAYVQHDQTIIPAGSKGGLTKLEYFAGLAMQSYITAVFTNKTDDPLGFPRNCANWSVVFARALLAELSKESEQ
jgi:hypothetical protein